MKTKNFMLYPTFETSITINIISMTVPCFISFSEMENGYRECTITARAEDWEFIERTLALSSAQVN